MKFLPLLALMCAAAAPLVRANTVWPKPSSMNSTGASLVIAPSATFTWVASGAPSQTLSDAFLRYSAITFGSAGPRGGGSGRRLAVATDPAATVTGIDVDVASADQSLTLETDESYTLTIAAPRAKISAATVYGPEWISRTTTALQIRPIARPRKLYFRSARVCVRRR
jgi:hypothetical protein